MAAILRGTLVGDSKVRAHGGDTCSAASGCGLWWRAGGGRCRVIAHGSCAELRPGFEPNPYTAQCLAPVNTPTINGIPCVASNIGLCSSFVQNQQPPRGPRPVG